MITFHQKGDFSKVASMFERMKHAIHLSSLDRYGEEGVEALASATPKDSGLTANSWEYEIVYGKDRASISFRNTNIQNGVPIAIILQYGHATKNGGWVEGRDYINPALRPVFDRIADEAWREVTKD